MTGDLRLPLVILTLSPAGFHGSCSRTDAIPVNFVGTTRSLRLAISHLAVVFPAAVRLPRIPTVPAIYAFCVVAFLSAF